MKYFIVAIIHVLFVYASCSKNGDCITQRYSFSTGIKAYPDNDSININDTIWLDFSCPTRLVDLNTGGLIEYSGAENLGTSIDFLEFTGGSITNPGAIAAVNSFEYKLIHGIFIPDDHLPEKNRDYKFTQVNSEYKFKLGIIPKRTGVFAITPGDASNVYRNNDYCTKASFSITFSNTNQHIYYYQQNRPGYIPSGYELTHMYCFKVK